MKPRRKNDPDVFLLPLAVEGTKKFRDLDPGVLARRLPDFLHQVINQCESGPTAMLELHSCWTSEQPKHRGQPGQPGQPDQGLQISTWTTWSRAPTPDEAFAMLPAGEWVRAVVTGKVAIGHEGLELELTVCFRADLESGVATTVQAIVGLDSPMAPLCKLAEHLARILQLPFCLPPTRLLTDSGPAFFRFLEGLDGTALLTCDMEIGLLEDAEALLQPYAEAMALDPEFGWALRAGHFSLALALEDSRVDESCCYRIIDGYLAALPRDGEACVQVARHLEILGEESRAIAWLEHATQLKPPPPRGLESLGIMRANRGEMLLARSLWLDGLRLDGHPDFFAHLARLAFAEGDLADAWEHILCGLRRMYERLVRVDEWGEEGWELGLILRYLMEHLAENEPPAPIVEALTDLQGLLLQPEDRLDLGLCLRQLGMLESSAAEIHAGLAGELEPELRDQAIRTLLQMEVDGFERRFAKAVDLVAVARDPRAAMRELESFLELQPEFWPAIFFRGMALKRLGQEDEALDRFADVLRLRPGQPEALFEMAQLFDRRGNPKRGLECVEEAMESCAPQPRYYACMATCFLHLGRMDEAKAALEQALDLEPENGEYLRLRAELELN